MNINDILKFVGEYLSEYLFLFISTLTSPQRLDEIMRPEYGYTVVRGSKTIATPSNANDRKIIEKVNSKLIGFIVISIFIGSILQNYFPNRPPVEELLNIVVVVFLMWIVLSTIIYLPLKILYKRVSFARVISVCLLVISVAHVTASFLALVVGILFSYAIFFYFVFQIVFLWLYLPMGISSLHVFSGQVRSFYIFIVPMILLIGGYYLFALLFFGKTNIILLPNPTTTPSPTVTLTPSPTVTFENIVITDIFYNGVKSIKEPDEYVEIRNDGAEPVQLNGWTLCDEAVHIFVFPSFIIEPGQNCRVYTNETHPEWCGFNFGNTGYAIWGNSGDCASLRDNNGSLIDKRCY